MFVISINHKNSTADVRESYSFGMEKSLELLESLQKNGITEAVYLNTCNRVELYVNNALEAAEDVFLDFSGVSKRDFAEHALVLEGNEAIGHLFYVCAGLQSMVLGEDEILGQMKRAYALARENGYTGYFFNTIFQSAFTAAKKIKTDTMLSKSSVSVATIAALKCHKFKEGMKNVLVIGATAEIGRKMVLNLLSYHDVNIYATKRHKAYLEDGVTLIDYDSRYDYIEWADIIVSCTKSMHYTISTRSFDVSEISDKPRLFVDLAVPKDIDKDVLQIPNSGLITIDEIEELAKENNELKLVEVESAEKIIHEEMDELLKNLCFHDFLPEFDRVKESIERNSGKFIYKYRKLATAEEFMSFLKIVRLMDEM